MAKQIDTNKESKMISPIAVAVNIGDLELLSTLLKCKTISIH